MSQAASQAAAFYRDVARDGRVWMLDDDEKGMPVMKVGDHEAVPVWSSESRLRKTLPHLSGGWQESQIKDVAWNDFCGDIVPGLAEEGILLGVNWSGENATGYDIPADEVISSVEGAREQA